MPPQFESYVTTEETSGAVGTGTQSKPVSKENLTPAEDKIRMHIILDPDCHDKLQKACEENERSVSAQIRYMIRQYL
jgi:hypothetical protein